MRTKQTARKAFGPLHTRQLPTKARSSLHSRSAISISPKQSVARPSAAAMASKNKRSLEEASGNGSEGASGSKGKKAKKDEKEHVEDEEEDIGSEGEDVDDEEVEGEEGEGESGDEDVDEEGEGEGDPDSEEEEYMQMLETFQEIVDSQTEVGSFPLNETFGRTLGISKAQLVKESVEKKVNGEAFTTALAIAFVDNRLHMEDNMTKEWEPMKAKATTWLHDKFPEEQAGIITAAKAYLEEM